jgi:hypothetical protein
MLLKKSQSALEPMQKYKTFLEIFTPTFGKAVFFAGTAAFHPLFSKQKRTKWIQASAWVLEHT